jgi:hypothetical protein
MMNRTVLMANLLLVVALLAGCRNHKEQAGQVDYSALRTKVIELVKNKTIVADSTGKALLPDVVKGASASGYIYISGNLETDLSVIFPAVSSAADVNGRGFLYSDNETGRVGQILQIGGFQWQLVRPGDRHFWMVTQL